MGNKSSTLDNLKVDVDKRAKQGGGFQETDRGLIKTNQKIKTAQVMADVEDESSRLVASKANLRRQFMKEREKSVCCVGQRKDSSLGERAKRTG